MCGVAGFISDFIPGLMAQMNAVQVHRESELGRVVTNQHTGLFAR